MANTPQTMNKQPNWWQILGMLISVMIPITIGLISQAQTIATLKTSSEIQKDQIVELKSNQYINSVKMDQGFEKINGKLEQLLVGMERKADRNK